MIAYTKVCMETVEKTYVSVQYLLPLVNRPLQYNTGFHGSRNVIFKLMICDIFLISDPNIVW